MPRQFIQLLVSLIVMVCASLHLHARPVIDGDDLAIIARSSINVPNQHDADHATFHRIKNFRSLALIHTPEPED